jgi:NAD(P)H-nitrite reductase large subunit
MRYVIIGNSAAGNAAAQAIRRRDQEGLITIVSEEAHPAYYRPLTASHIYGGVSDETMFWDKARLPKDVNLMLGRQAQSVLAEQRTVILDKGERLGYDKLLLATGARPTRPPISGLEGPGTFVLHSLDDARAIAAATGKAKHAVVLGGGRIGTKVALALHRLGLQVAVVEILPRIVPAQLDGAASGIFGHILERAGIQLYLGQRVTQVERKRGVLRRDEELERVILEDGRSLKADLLVVAVGVSPNLELAQEAGVAVKQGVLVDSHMATNLPDIYAAGDVVETVDLVTGQAMVSGTWTNAVNMGQRAGENMAGGKREYPGALAVFNAMVVADHLVVSLGIIDPPLDSSYVYAA